uniref:Calponin-homology (CH) domain-containing protein n=1 Tax=Eptatretus burgeri TaxID=7764 RepID=A0A8C4QBY5_EPTBU
MDEVVLRQKPSIVSRIEKYFEESGVLLSKAEGAIFPGCSPSGLTLNPSERKRTARRDRVSSPASQCFCSPQALLKFANKHLKNLSLSVDNLAQFGDGVLLILLIGQLEGFFVPLYKYHVIPENKEHKTHNVQVALKLIEESEITHTSWGVLQEGVELTLSM